MSRLGPFSMQFSKKNSIDEFRGVTNPPNYFSELRVRQLKMGGRVIIYQYVYTSLFLIVKDNLKKNSKE